MMRTWPILLAGCATAAPASAPLAHHAAAPHAHVAPAGMFVADLLERRVSDDSSDRAVRGVASARLVAYGPESIRVIPRRPSTTVTVQYCIDDTGHVTSVRASGAVTRHDTAAVDRIRSWRFAPYFVDGKPITVCSYLSFVSDSAQWSTITDAD